MANSSSHELLEHTIRPGSSFYYSTLTLNNSERKKLGVLFALFNEWLSLRENSSEPQVAHTALAWWLEQVNQLGDQSNSPATHPLLQQLNFLGESPELKSFVLTRMQSIIASFIQTPPYFENTNSLNSYLQNTWGDFCVIYGACLTNNLTGYKDSILIQQQIGTTIGYYSIVKQLAGQLNKQRFLLPQSWLNEIEATQTLLVSSLKYNGTNKIKSQFLSKICQHLESQHTKLEQLLSDDHYPLKSFNHLPAFVALKLESNLYKLTIKHGFKIFEYRLQLSPLRKLWISWRCKRHFKKQRSAKLAALD